MAEEGTPPLKSELQALKPSQRRKRLADAGASEAEIEEAEDADDALEASVALLLKYQPPAAAEDRGAALVAELEALKPSQRKKRALAAGATEDEVEEAGDADDALCLLYTSPSPRDRG